MNADEARTTTRIANGSTAPRAGGLEGVVVAETRLSDVDGEAGKLTVAGHDVEAIAGAMTFEQVAALLWDQDARAAERGIAEGRVMAFERLADIGAAFAHPDGMDALRASVAQLSVEQGFADPARLTGAVATFAAAWSATRAGRSPLAPDPSLSHAEDYLRMATGRADQARAKAVEAYLVTVMDHGMNASTFTARVVASTGSDLVSAIVAAIGALKGPLHGGAPGPVLDMLDAVGSPDRAVAWIEAELVAGRRIMGMGHRIYRVRDPRAAVLERAALKLEESGVPAARLDLARAVERAADGVLKQRYPDRPLRANVEFYTAVLLDTVGLDRAVFSATFAVGRAAGWAAHVLEQRATGRLIRPASTYVR